MERTTRGSEKAVLAKEHAGGETKEGGKGTTRGTFPNGDGGFFREGKDRVLKKTRPS